MRFVFASLVAVAAVVAVPAQAKSYQIGISAVVPVECELTTSGTVEAVGATTYRIARVQQFCNSNYRLELRSAPLSTPSTATFRGEIADVTTGSATLVAAGRPVNSSAELFLTSVDPANAQLFAQTLWLQVSPTGV
jgi:hypothetical protein